MTFELNVGQNLLGFRKVTSVNLKIGELPVTLATTNFQELFVIKFNSQVKVIQNRILLVKGIYHEKTVKGTKMLPLRVK